MDGLEFRILGPLEVWRDGVAVPVTAGRQRAVLATLLLHPNRVVATDRLVGLLWGDDPPATARTTVQTLVHRLRRLLAPADESGTSQPLLTRPPGYLLRIGPEQLDLSRFEELVRRGREALADGHPEQASRLLGEAVSLWRGPPLGDVDADELRRIEGARLEEWYLQAIEERLEADLHQGRDAELVGELRRLVAEHPLRERPYGQLMRALYRAGRQAEALDTYRALRTVLVEQLGVEPEPAIQRLHQAILRNSPEPAPAAAHHPPTAGVVPGQLPADGAVFTGRGEVLAWLDAALAADREPTALPVVVVIGAPGVGKTTVAVHWAHRVRDRFPDGQLYLNLRGFEPSEQVMEPGEAVRYFLDALHVPPQRIPATLDSQTALYRSLLSGKRMLIVLDNARDTGQVRPLLPGTPGCLVLVTSRNQLSGLVATESAHSITIDLLTDGEAREFLADRLGHDRIDAEPDPVREIITQCARLPLALAIMAARVVTNPRIRLSTIAAELRDTHRRWAALRGDDPTMDVRAVFSWSYRTISSAAARLFRLLGLHPGPDLTAAAAASIGGAPPAEAWQLLGELARAHLVVEQPAGRFLLHDLLRAYAADQVHTDPEPQRHAATRRMIDHYLHSAYAAERLLNEHGDPIALDPPAPGVSPERPTDHSAALAWLTADHPVLLAMVSQSATAGFDTHTWRLAGVLGAYLDRRGHWHDWITVGHLALSAAQRAADPGAQAQAHRHLARASANLGRLDDTQTHLRRALDLTRGHGDLAGQAHIELLFSDQSARQGHNAEALDHARQALDLYRTAGHLQGKADALNTVGWYHALLGEYEHTITYCEQALALHRELGHGIVEATTWDSLGYAHHHLGNHPYAVTCYQRAIYLFHDLGARYPEAETLTRLGDTHQAAGRPDAAHQAWRRALAILDDLDHPEADSVRVKLRSANGSGPTAADAPRG